ncbi:MAG: septation protein SpoVG family protein [Elusimicrobia bacterium]|nr:septation protein SpoVG family protein [Elusimicrobiota bacterium]
MEISDVRVYLRNENKLKAFVTITLGKVLVVHNMKVIQGQKGLILCMPSRKGPDGKFRDVVHPITNEFRRELENKVFATYEEEVKKLSQGIHPKDNNDNTKEAPQDSHEHQVT